MGRPRRHENFDHKTNSKAQLKTARGEMIRKIRIVDELRLERARRKETT